MKHEIISAEYYCENGDCPARQMNVWLKFYEKVNLTIFNKKKLLCPICEKKLTIHYQKKY